MSKLPGHSLKRTPAKHRLLDTQLGHELGAAPYIQKKFGGKSYYRFDGMLIVDLTAGDADPSHDPTNELHRSSSPLLFARHAVTHGHSVRIRLYERDHQIFDRLINNLEHYLPQLRDKQGSLGYDRIGSRKWASARTGSTVRAICGDGSEEDFSDLRLHEWLFVNNDPNTMQGWCLDMPAFAYALQTRPGTFMSTMGCNPGGLKRLSSSERDRWWDYVWAAKRFVDQHSSLTLILVPLLNDPSQWAYLQIVPRRWVGRACKEIRNDLQKEDCQATLSLYPDQVERFDMALRVLFKTKTELGDLDA